VYVLPSCLRSTEHHNAEQEQRDPAEAYLHQFRYGHVKGLDDENNEVFAARKTFNMFFAVFVYQAMLYGKWPDACMEYDFRLSYGTE
jgi:hypothetical protein